MAEKLVFKNFSISTGLILVNNKNLDWILVCEIILDLEMVWNLHAFFANIWNFKINSYQFKKVLTLVKNSVKFS